MPLLPQGLCTRAPCPLVQDLLTGQVSARTPRDTRAPGPLAPSPALPPCPHLCGARLPPRVCPQPGRCLTGVRRVTGASDAPGPGGSGVSDAGPGRRADCPLGPPSVQTAPLRASVPPPENAGLWVRLRAQCMPLASAPTALGQRPLDGDELRAPRPSTGRKPPRCCTDHFLTADRLSLQIRA